MLKRSTTHGITGGRWKDSRMRQMIADLVIRGDVVTLETIAGVLLSDANLDEIRQPFVDVADDVLALACQAHTSGLRSTARYWIPILSLT
jgi:hypothetical protein